ncbi:MAG: hypothetical protein ABI687_13660, partial [Flavitalea sp.]
MAISNNQVTAGMTGAMGKQIVFRKLHGKTVASAYPNMDDRILTPKQVNINQLMKRANGYAKGIMNDEQQRNAAQLRFNTPRNKLYTSLIREYFTLHHIKEEKNNFAEPAPEKDNPFVHYLLQNTDKTIEEIAALARVSAEYVEKAKMLIV